MSVINHALNNIFNRIPNELLTKAFPPSQFYGYVDNRSLEERIKDEVIDQMVIPDANLVGGQQVTINISDLSPRQSGTGIIYEIPLNKTQGRKISAVLSIDYGVATGVRNSAGYGDALVDKLMDTVSNVSEGPRSSATSDVKLIGPNVVWVGEHVRTNFAWLRCRLNNDENMANLSSRGSVIFSEMVMLATKGIIFRKLRIALGEGSLTGGSLNGYLSGMLDEYSDSFELYDELKNTKWRKVSIMADEETHREMTRLSLRPF